MVGEVRVSAPRDTSPPHSGREGRERSSTHRIHDTGGHEMIQAGQTVENPVTGERMIFRKTAADTGGELVEFELIARPGAFVFMPHVHPFQTERFEVLSGAIEVKTGRKRQVANAGD